jgi:hypothetical protein
MSDARWGDLRDCDARDRNDELPRVVGAADMKPHESNADRLSAERDRPLASFGSRTVSPVS